MNNTQDDFFSFRFIELDDMTCVDLVVLMPKSSFAKTITT